MCGIVGAVGANNIVSSLLKGLAILEYRGYDSAGVVAATNDNVACIKVAGKVKDLAYAMKEANLTGTCGIGHTRWATHGEPTTLNAHPIANDTLYLVHNGIIENYAELKSELHAQGYQFHTQTDTEVIAALIAYYSNQGKSNMDAVRSAAKRCHGAYAVAVLFRNEPQQVIGCRQGAPLLIGIGQDVMYFGSDAAMLAEFVSEVIDIADSQVAIITHNDYKIYNIEDGVEIYHTPRQVTPQGGSDKEGYAHYMLKEIYEQPNSLLRCLSQYYDPRSYNILSQLDKIDFRKVSKIRCIACGTSLYAAQVARYWLEQYAKIPTETEIASEFRYRTPVLIDGELCIFISQSGETADTVAALRYIQEAKVQTLAIVNVLDSAIARLSDNVLPIYAGLEIGVASTKAFTGQLMVLALLALRASCQCNAMTQEEAKAILNSLHNLAPVLEQALTSNQKIAELAIPLSAASKIFYIGRGSAYPIALEGALKMKELSYIPTEGVAAGELKHGPIALIDDSTFVIAVAPYDGLFAKTASNVQEVQARKGNVILLSNQEGCDSLKDLCYATIALPDSNDFTAPLLYALAVQLMAYHTALYKGHDVDQPRNLAKSVTVE